MAIHERRYQKPRHSFRGESDGANVVNYLNGEGNRRSQRLVLSILADAKALLSHGEREANGTFKVKDSNRFQEVRERFNRKIKRYKTVPAFSPFSADRWHFTQLFTGGNFPLGEFLATHSILGLARLGLLDRVKQCEYCSKWFFALFSHQRCCGKPSLCRVKLYQSSEEHKRLKREASKKAYWEMKQQEARWLRMSKKSH